MECPCQSIWFTFLNHLLRCSSNVASSINPFWIFPAGSNHFSLWPSKVSYLYLSQVHSSFSTLQLFVHMINTLTCLWDPWDQSYSWFIFFFSLYNTPHNTYSTVDAEKIFAWGIHKKWSSLIKVTYKSILGTGKEPNCMYNMKYSARHSYFWKCFYFV